MYEARLLQNSEGIEQLGGENLHELSAETLELVLLDQLVQVGREQFEDEAQVVLVDERVAKPENVVLVVRVTLVVQLRSTSVLAT